MTGLEFTFLWVNYNFEVYCKYNTYSATVQNTLQNDTVICRCSHRDYKRLITTGLKSLQLQLKELPV